jgi:hypothetical protein
VFHTTSRRMTAWRALLYSIRGSVKQWKTLARLLISLGTREAIQARVGAALRLSERHIEPSKWAGSLCAPKEQRSG